MALKALVLVQAVRLMAKSSKGKAWGILAEVGSPC